LDSTNFKETPKPRKSRRRGDMDEGDKTSIYSPLTERRDALYRNVVAPLLWLATVGFEDTEEVPVVPLRKKIRREPKFADREEIQSFWNGIRGDPLFHSDSPSSTPNFLEKLQRIAGHIHRCPRKVKITNQSASRSWTLDAGETWPSSKPLRGPKDSRDGKTSPVRARRRRRIRLATEHSWQDCSCMLLPLWMST
jgi:hypothetical protein